MKKIFTLVLMAFILTSCFSGTSDNGLIEPNDKSSETSIDNEIAVPKVDIDSLDVKKLVTEKLSEEESIVSKLEGKMLKKDNSDFDEVNKELQLIQEEVDSIEKEFGKHINDIDDPNVKGVNEKLKGMKMVRDSMFLVNNDCENDFETLKIDKTEKEIELIGAMNGSKKDLLNAFNNKMKVDNKYYKCFVLDVKEQEEPHEVEEEYFKIVDLFYKEIYNK